MEFCSERTDNQERSTPAPVPATLLRQASQAQDGSPALSLHLVMVWRLPKGLITRPLMLGPPLRLRPC
jgi:hypothetical protein